MFAHACTRSALLVMAGIFFSRSDRNKRLAVREHSLPDQLGYIFAFMLVGRGLMMQLGYLALVLGGYTAIFIHYDAMGFGMSPAQLGVSEDDLLPGAFAPFTRDVNFAAGFDRWFLNLFPRGETWEMHPEGVQTLNFVPSIATMVIGVMAGELLRTREEPELKFNALLMAGVPCLMFGVLLGISFCPIISRLWTASWVFVSAAFVRGRCRRSIGWWRSQGDACGYGRWPCSGEFPPGVSGLGTPGDHQSSLRSSCISGRACSVVLMVRPGRACPCWGDLAGLRRTRALILRADLKDHDCNFHVLGGASAMPTAKAAILEQFHEPLRLCEYPCRNRWSSAPP